MFCLFVGDRFSRHFKTTKIKEEYDISEGKHALKKYDQELIQFNFKSQLDEIDVL